MLAFHKIAISRKTKSFGTFWVFFLDTWIFGIINQIIQKDLSKNEVYKFYQAKRLVITHEKDDGVKMVLFYRLQQNVSVELHMI